MELLTVESLETVHGSLMCELAVDDLMEQTTEEENLSALAVGEPESVVLEVQGTILAVEQLTEVHEIQGDQEFEWAEMVDGTPVDEFAGYDLMEQTTEDQIPNAFAVGEPESIVPEIKGTILAVEQLTVIPEIQGDHESELAEMVDGTLVDEFAVDDLMDQITEDQNPNAFAVGEPESIVLEIKGTNLAVEQLTEVPEIQEDQESESAEMVDGTPMGEFLVDDLMEQTMEDQNPNALAVGEPESIVLEIKGTNLAVEQLTVAPEIQGDQVSELTDMVDGTPMGEFASDDLMEQIAEDQFPTAAVACDQETYLAVDNSPVTGMDHPLDNPNPENGDSKGTRPPKRKSEELSAEKNMKNVTGSIKKIKITPQKWECSICQVLATSEQHLRDHIQGKKHKAKVTKLKLLSSSSSSSSGDDNGKISTNELTSCSGDVNGDNNINKSAEAGISYLSAENEEKEGVATTEPTKKKTAYWCEICGVGTNSEDQMAIHQRGKKHISSAAKLGLPSQQKLAIVGQDRVKIKLASKEESKDQQTSVLAKVALLEQVVAEAAGKSCEVGVCMGQRKNGMKFFCKTCRVTMYDEMKMDKHRKSEKHMDMVRKNHGALIVISKIQTETDGELVGMESDATAAA